MSKFARFLFPVRPDGAGISLLLLALRILFGLLLLSHGMQKWTHYADIVGSFPDPLGVGRSISLGLAIFAELGCSVGFIFGALYRLVLIPMIFTMGVAFFVIHGEAAFAAKELAFVYLIVFIILYITGPGRFSVDWWIGRILSKEK